MVLDQTVALLTARVGRAMLQLSIAEAMDEALARVSSNPSFREPEAVRALVERAVTRGEWDVQRSPPEVVFAMMTGAVLHRLLLERLDVGPAWREGLLDTVLLGISPAGRR